MTIKSKFINSIVEDMTPKQVRYLQPVQADQASGKLADIYQQVRGEFQLFPPITLFSPAPDLLAGSWSIVRESQIVTGHVPRQIKEAVASAVSRINTCPYCVDAHIGMLHGTSGHDVANAILENDTNQINDPKLRDIISWALASKTPASQMLATPPFSSNEAPEIIGTALAYHLVNRMVSIFLSPSPLPVKDSFPRLKKIAVRVFGATVAKSILKNDAIAGASLAFLPTAELADDFAWAKPNTHITSAFAGFSSLMEKAGHETVPERVREHLLHHLQQWQGEDKGLGRQWLEEAVADLQAPHQDIARLVLLTAFAPYQVDKEIIDNFRKHAPSDAELLAATGWASYVTIKRISQWLIQKNKKGE